MPEGTIQLPPDGVGPKKLRTKEVTVNSVVVEQEVVCLADPDGTDVYPNLFARDSTLTANFGADGATPPSIAGAGVRGWLRAIYDRLTAGVGRTWTLGSGTDAVTVAGTVAVSNPTANPETGLAKDATLTGRLPAALDADGGIKVHQQNPPASQPVTGPLTDTQLRAATVPVSGTVTANLGTIDGAATETTLATLLTNTQLRASAVQVKDDYQTGEVLADQAGAGAVLTFTFASAVQLVVVDANGATTDVARTDPFGGTPTATLGIPCRDETPTFMPVVTTSVKVFAPTGMVVSCWGYRRS